MSSPGTCDPEMLAGLEKTVTDLGLTFEGVEREEVGARADVIITITSCDEPLLMNEWIRPGTPPCLHGHRHQGQDGSRSGTGGCGHRLHR